MAAPAFASYTVTVDNSLTLNTPTEAASGDLLLVIFQSDGNSDFDAGSNGFIAGGRLYSDIDCTTEWFYLPLNGAPAASYTFTRTGGGACRGWMIRITGANLSSPIDVSGFQEDTASNTAHDLPTLTTTVADTLLLAFSLVSSGAAYASNEFTPPSGYTEISETGTAWCHVSAAWKAQTAAGSTGSASFTGVSAQSLQLLLAVKPAATGHALTLQSGTLGLQAPALSLSQTHGLAAPSATLTPQAPSATLSQTHGLAFQAAALTPSAPALTLSQTHPLAFQSGTLSFSGGALALSQTHALAAPAASLGLAGAAVALNLSHALAATPGVQALTGAALALQQSHSLALTAGVLSLEGTPVAVYSQTLEGSSFRAVPERPRYRAVPERPKYLARKE